MGSDVGPRNGGPPPYTSSRDYDYLFRPVKGHARLSAANMLYYVIMSEPVAPSARHIDPRGRRRGPRAGGGVEPPSPRIPCTGGHPSQFKVDLYVKIMMLILGMTHQMANDWPI